MISAEDLRIEELRLRYLELIERPDVFPTRANWEFITSNAMHGLGHALYRKYLTAVVIDDNDREQLHDIAIEEFPRYLAAIDRNEALEVVYNDVVTVPDATIGLIRDNMLFDATQLMDLIDEGNLLFVLKILDVYQPIYSEMDIKPMEELLKRLDNIPSTGRIETKSGIFGSSEKFICPDGHVNPGDVEYCHHSGCGKNIRGLSEVQENTIILYSQRIKALKGLLHQL